MPFWKNLRRRYGSHYRQSTLPIYRENHRTGHKDSDKTFNLSDNIDRLVTNRFLALPIFAAVMWLTYFLSIQTVGTMGTDWVNDVLFGELVPGLIQENLDRFEIAGWLQSLVLDGIIAGCGAILGFVPQIFVLFVCLGILEDIGI